jgi:hypothetical protein
MTPKEIETIRSAIKQKLELLDTMGEQMEPYMISNTLTPATLQKYHTAKECYHAAWMKLEDNKLDEAVYFIMRGSWNTGEFLACSKHDRAGAADPAPTLSLVPSE